MYPSSINRALCSDGMRCIKPLAPSRNETNSSRVNVGADWAILGICASGGQDQETSRIHLPASPQDSCSRWSLPSVLPGKDAPAVLLGSHGGASKCSGELAYGTRRF